MVNFYHDKNMFRSYVSLLEGFRDRIDEETKKPTEEQGEALSLEDMKQTVHSLLNIVENMKKMFKKADEEFHDLEEQGYDCSLSADEASEYVINVVNTLFLPSKHLMDEWEIVEEEEDYDYEEEEDYYE